MTVYQPNNSFLMDVNEDVLIAYNLKIREKNKTTTNSNFNTLFSLFFCNYTVNPELALGVRNVVTARPYQIGFQEATSTSIEAIVNFHADLITYLFGIIVFLGVILSGTLFRFSIYNNENNVRVF